MAAARIRAQEVRGGHAENASDKRDPCGTSKTGQEALCGKGKPAGGVHLLSMQSGLPGTRGRVPPACEAWAPPPCQQHRPSLLSPERSRPEFPWPITRLGLTLPRRLRSYGLSASRTAQCFCSWMASAVSSNSRGKAIRTGPHSQSILPRAVTNEEAFRAEDSGAACRSARAF